MGSDSSVLNSHCYSISISTSYVAYLFHSHILLSLPSPMSCITNFTLITLFFLLQQCTAVFIVVSILVSVSTDGSNDSATYINFDPDCKNKISIVFFMISFLQTKINHYPSFNFLNVRPSLVLCITFFILFRVFFSNFLIFTILLIISRFRSS